MATGGPQKGAQSATDLSELGRQYQCALEYERWTRNVLGGVLSAATEGEDARSETAALRDRLTVAWLEHVAI